jgi:hypothetical protein
MPVWITGRFTDDYGSRYTINDSLFIMDSSIRYHVLEWNEQGQYILAQNDLSNKTDKGLFTRIDYMRFNGMEPFTWGYCFTIFNAPDRQAALQKRCLRWPGRDNRAPLRLARRHASWNIGTETGYFFCFEAARDQWGPDGSGCHGINADAFINEAVRQGTGKGDDGTFCSGVIDQ